MKADDAKSNLDKTPKMADSLLCVASMTEKAQGKRPLGSNAGIAHLYCSFIRCKQKTHFHITNAQKHSYVQTISIFPSRHQTATSQGNSCGSDKTAMVSR